MRREGKRDLPLEENPIYIPIFRALASGSENSLSLSKKIGKAQSTAYVQLKELQENNYVTLNRNKYTLDFNVLEEHFKKYVLSQCKNPDQKGLYEKIDNAAWHATNELFRHVFTHETPFKTLKEIYEEIYSHSNECYGLLASYVYENMEELNESLKVYNENKELETGVRWMVATGVMELLEKHIPLFRLLHNLTDIYHCDTLRAWMSTLVDEILIQLKNKPKSSKGV